MGGLELVVGVVVVGVVVVGVVVARPAAAFAAAAFAAAAALPRPPLLLPWPRQPPWPWRAWRPSPSPWPRPCSLWRPWRSSARLEPPEPPRCTPDRAAWPPWPSLAADLDIRALRFQRPHVHDVPLQGGDTGGVSYGDGRCLPGLEPVQPLLEASPDPLLLMLPPPESGAVAPYGSCELLVLRGWRSGSGSPSWPQLRPDRPGSPWRPKSCPRRRTAITSILQKLRGSLVIIAVLLLCWRPVPLPHLSSRRR